MWLQVINKVKVTHQGQSKISTPLQILCSPYSLQAGGLHLPEMLLVSQASVIPSVHGGRGVCIQGAVCLQGVCIQGGLPTTVLHPGGVCLQDVCIQRGVCIQVGWADPTPPPPSDTTGYGQRAGGTHPTGMHSCQIILF